MKKSKSFYISLILCFLNLVIPVAYFIYHKSHGHMIEFRNFTLDISLFSFILSMVFLLIKKISGKVKVVLTLIILCATSIFCTYVGLIGGFVVFESFNGIDEVKSYNESYESHGRRYEDVYKLEKIELSSYGEFEDISHYYYFSSGIIQQVGYTTIVKYNDEYFENEIEKIKYENTFHNKEADSILSYAGFDFILLTEEDENNLLPDEVNYIGINEATNEIAYVCSMYALADAFDDLLETDCGWRYIIEERAKM